MARKRRSNPGPEALIIPVAIILVAVAQAMPGGIDDLDSLFKRVLLILAFAGAAWFFYRRLGGQSKPGSTETRTKAPIKSRAVQRTGGQNQSKTPSHFSTSSGATPTANVDAPNSLPSTWNLELLQQLEWKRFEQLCEAYFRAKQLDAKMTGVGADGGVDICLYQRNSDQPLALLQCKAWSGRVGVKPVRELYGVMAAEKVEQGIFLCSGDYTNEARNFCKGKRLRLMSGQNLVNAILKLELEEQQKLLTIATEGDYCTPTCPSCDIKLIERKGPRNTFWGCRRYPRCRYTVPMRKSQLKKGRP